MSKTISEKLVEIAENEPRVFEAGKSKGYTEGLNKGGYADGFEAGKQAEWDAFWDAFQYSGGTRSGYAYAFYGGGWNDITFKPKYILKPSNATYMFRASNITEIIDVDYKTNKCNTFFGTYRGCAELVRVGDIYAGYATNLGEMFHGCSKLVSTGVITVKDTANFDVSFYGCEELVNITFDGTIGTDIAFTESTKLTADSIRSIIEHLSDTVKKDEGKTLTLSRAAVDTAIANGGFGDDTVYVHIGGPITGAYVHFNPIPLKAGDKMKISIEVEDGHHYNDFRWGDTVNDWYVGMNPYGGEPYYTDEIYTARNDEQVTDLMAYVITPSAMTVSFKLRAVLIDDNGNEITGENLAVPITGNFIANKVSFYVGRENWETLQASKPNWTISLV